MKKTLYPKTKRITNKREIVVTEKLDGSNLGIFKLNGELVFAQRNNVLKECELVGVAYKGLIDWVVQNRDDLMDLHDGSGVFGEWIGMGVLGYEGSDIDKKFYVFAKANLYEENGEVCVKNINYERDLFIYPFQSQKIPGCIGVVPMVTSIKSMVSVQELDNIYIDYCKKVNRSVEGFVVFDGYDILKYVRMKNGTLAPHKE